MLRPAHSLGLDHDRHPGPVPSLCVTVVALGSWIVVGSLCVQLVVSPFGASRLNWLESLSLAAVYVSGGRTPCHSQRIGPPCLPAVLLR